MHEAKIVDLREFGRSDRAEGVAAYFLQSAIADVVSEHLDVRALFLV